MNYVKSNTDEMLKIGVNKSILKEYIERPEGKVYTERKVYMDPETEFQLYLFNPTTETIKAEIYLNDKKISNCLVLYPGEKVWLERYLDNNAKFKFHTYEVGNTESAKKAIAANGKVKVVFYKEQQHVNTYVYPVLQPIKIADPYPWNGGILYASTSEPVNNYYSSVSGSSEVRGLGDAEVLSLDSALDSVSTINYCDCNTSITGSAATSACTATSSTSAVYSASTIDMPSTSSAKPKTRSKSRSLETGIIERGSHSDQKFDYVDKEFNYWSFKTEEIQILPISQKPYTKNDVNKVYCHNCGKKLKTNYKFCPACGAKVE